MALTSQYNKAPVQGRIGQGVYTYNFIIDTELQGVRKWEIFANTVEEAIGYITNFITPVANFNYIDKDTMSLVVPLYNGATCLLYI
jgi:hypothetical protein